jgi:hypothetical protein
MSNKEFVAERELLFSLKGESQRHPLVVRVGYPYLLDKTNANFAFDVGAAGCTISFDGLDATPAQLHGIDSLHALALAVDIDRHLRGMSKDYNFYWSTGEAYFED